MKIEVLTSLYPGPSRPFEGVFVERRWIHMLARGHSVRITHPLPRTPGPLARGKWAEIRDLPRRETRAGLEIERPRYFHWPRSARANAERFAALGTRAILAHGRPDVVVADYAWPAAAAAPLLRRREIPCVVSGRGSDVLEVAGEAGLGTLLTEYLRAADNWCAVSRDLLRVMDELGGAPGRGVLVPNGVDVEIFHPGDRARARLELGLEAEGTLVLVCGHLIERKDPLLALESFARAFPNEGRCAFVGRGPLRERLVARARELGVESRVRFTGEVEPRTLALWYAACNALLLTSKREGRPNVVLEALASGRPVVATEAGGTAEVLSGWEDASVVRARDPQAVARKLTRLLAAAPAPAELVASVAAYSWEASCQALEECLEGAIAGEPAPAERR